MKKQEIRNRDSQQHQTGHANPILWFTDLLSVFDEFITNEKYNQDEQDGNGYPLRQETIIRLQKGTDDAYFDEQPNEGIVFAKEVRGFKKAAYLFFGFALGVAASILLYLLRHL